MRVVTKSRQKFAIHLAFLGVSLSPVFALAGTLNYQYDALDRLTQVTYADGTIIAYAYDATGNRLSRVVTGGQTTDTDGDGLSDAIELALGTNPGVDDTDADGLTDYDEVARDGNPNAYAVGQDTDPNNPDTDGDTILDGEDAEPLSGTKIVPTLPQVLLWLLALILAAIGTSQTRVLRRCAK